MSALSGRNVKKKLGMNETLSSTEMNYNDVTTLGTAQASKAVTADANLDVTGLRNFTITGTLGVGTIASTGVNATQQKVTSAAVTANANVTYADVTGLTGIALVAGATYKFRLVLPSTVASGTGGIKYSFKYTTATLTSLESTAVGFAAAGLVTQHTTTATDNADLLSSATVTLLTVIEGTMVVNAAGTLAVQVAQSVSNASNTVALVGGTATFTRTA